MYIDYEVFPSTERIYIQFWINFTSAIFSLCKPTGLLKFYSSKNESIDFPDSNEYKTVNKTTLPNISKVASMITSSWYVDYNAVCLDQHFYLFLT